MSEDVKSFSVFISSTFRDMQEERDYLNKFVFPALNKELINKKIQLNVVDLRWGINTGDLEEKLREEKVLKVCLDEIENSQPFFLVLLGERYGWIPHKERVQKALARFNENKNLKVNADDKSVTELEIDLGIFFRQNDLDTRFIFLRETDSYKHIPHSVQYNYIDDKENIQRQNRLKSKIIQHFDEHGFSENIQRYQLEWDSTNHHFKKLELFGEMVRRAFLNEIEKRLKNESPKKLLSWCEQEKERIKNYCIENTIIRLGRGEFIASLGKKLLEYDGANVLTGGLGMGKSYIFSALYQMFMRNEEVVLLAFSSEALDYSIQDVLKYWNWELADFLIKRGDASEYEILKLVEDESQMFSNEKILNEFNRLVLKVSSEKKIIILLDSVDELMPTPAARYMTWLPGTWFKNTSLLVTCSPEVKSDVLSQNLYLSESNIPPLQLSEAQKLVQAYFLRKRKQLYEEVESKILSKKMGNNSQFAYESPLWLSMICGLVDSIDAKDFEEIWASQFSTEKDIVLHMNKIIDTTSHDPSELFSQLVEKAIKDIDSEFVIGLLFLLAHSKYGSRESDLAEMIPFWNQLLFTNLLLLLKDKIKFNRKTRILSFEHEVFKIAVLSNKNLLKYAFEVTGKKAGEKSPVDFYATLFEDYFYKLPDNDFLKHKELVHILFRNKSYSRFKEYVGLNIGEKVFKNELIKVIIQSAENEIIDFVKKVSATEYPNTFIKPGIRKNIYVYKLISQFRQFLEVDFAPVGDKNKHIILLETIIDLLNEISGKGLITNDILNIEQTIYKLQLYELVSEKRKLEVLEDAKSKFSPFCGILSLFYGVFFGFFLNHLLTKVKIEQRQFLYQENSAKTGLKLLMLRLLPRIFRFVHLTKTATKLNGDELLSRRERIKKFNYHFRILGGLPKILERKKVKFKNGKEKSLIKYGYCIGKRDFALFYFKNRYYNIALLLLENVLEDLSFNESKSSLRYSVFSKLAETCLLYTETLWKLNRKSDCLEFFKKTEVYFLRGIREYPNEIKYKQWFRRLIETLIQCDGYNLLGFDRNKHQEFLMKWDKIQWIYNIGEEYYNDFEEFKQEGFEWVLKAAELNNTDAFFEVGLVYFNGEIVERNFEKARYWFERSGKTGNKVALFNLGVIYHNGDGIEQNYSKALEYFLMAAEMGYTACFKTIAMYYREGKGTEKDPKKAIYWENK